MSDGAASDAITASVESRTSQEHVSVLGFNHVDNGLFGFFQVLVEVGVTADNSGNDLSLIAESLIESCARAYNALSQLRFDISLIRLFCLSLQHLTLLNLVQ